MKETKAIILIVLAGIVLVSAGYYWGSRTGSPANNGGTPSDNQQGKTDNTDNIIPKQKTLDLSRKGLTKVSQEVFKNSDLEELNLSFNELTGALPAEIRQLRRLKVLKASDNKMTGIPAEIGQLSDLEVLDLSNNMITGLPLEIKNLKKLKTFNLSGNDYSKQDLDQIKAALPNLNVITQ